MKSFFIPGLVLLFLLTGCLHFSTLEEYSFDQVDKKFKINSVLIYKIIIEGDNYDGLAGHLILDQVNMYLKKLNCSVLINEDVFVNDIDLKSPSLIVKDDKKEQLLEDEFYLAEDEPKEELPDFDLAVLMIIRIKDLGYSLQLLRDEQSLTINNLLMDSQGKIVNSVLFSKSISYSLSASRKIYKDIKEVMKPMDRFILVKRKNEKRQ